MNEPVPAYGLLGPRDRQLGDLHSGPLRLRAPPAVLRLNGPRRGSRSHPSTSRWSPWRSLRRSLDQRTVCQYANRECHGSSSDANRWRDGTLSSRRQKMAVKSGRTPMPQCGHEAYNRLGSHGISRRPAHVKNLFGYVISSCEKRKAAMVQCQWERRLPEDRWQGTTP